MNAALKSGSARPARSQLRTGGIFTVHLPTAARAYIGSHAMIARLTLHTMLTTLVIAGAAFAWQARGEDPSATAASFAAALGYEIGLDEDED